MFKLTKEDLRNLRIYDNTYLEIMSADNKSYKKVYFSGWNEEGYIWHNLSRTTIKGLLKRKQAKIVIYY